MEIEHLKLNISDVESVVINAMNRIELKCREAVFEGRITQAQADRRIRTAKEVVEFILDKRLVERRENEQIECESKKEKE